MKNIIPASFVLLLISFTLAAQESTEKFEKTANRLVKAVNDANWPGVQADFGQVVMDAFPLEKLTPFFQEMTAKYGRIEKMGAARYTPPNQAVFPIHFERGALDMKIVLDMQDKIIGLWFLPHLPDIPIVEKHRTELSLPFKGKWFVFWGGDTKELNLHHDIPNQQFAVDFMGLDENGKTRRGEGKVNEDYLAFGREITAPADGEITDVINGVRDNMPGSMNPYSALGNAVIIRHRENEFSVLAHLKNDSIKVKVRDKVTRGQLLACCGNSGNSSEPHLHYHLQNTPIIQDGTGIKCLFGNVKMSRDSREEQVKINYSPVKGDVVTAD